jgi:hypothetical protein
MAISTIGGSSAATGELGGTVVGAGFIPSTGGKIPISGGLPAGDYVIEFRGTPVYIQSLYTYSGITPRKIATNVYTYNSNDGGPKVGTVLTVPAACDGLYFPASSFVGGVTIRKWTTATPATLTEYNWNATGQATNKSMSFTKAGYHCAYGNGKHVATEYSSSSGILVSSDAYSWSVQAYIGYAYAIAFGNGKFVMTYNGYQYAKVATSTNGSGWTERTIPTTTYWNWVHYCSSLSTPKWIVTGSTGKACTATDPDGTWTAANIATLPDYQVFIVKDGGGVAVAVQAGSQTYYTSTDLVTWTSRSLPAALSGDPYLTHHNGIFVLSGVGDGKIYTSTNGINWSGNTAPTTSINNVSSNGYPVVSGNGYFMLGPVPTNGQSYYWFSADGINWAERMLNSSYGWFTHIGDTWAVALPYSQSSISTYRTTASADTLI